MLNNPYSWLDKSLATIHQANWYRQVQTVTSLPGPVIELDGQKLINFASNDYLGLAGDDRVIEAAINATKAFGTGTTGSRLLTGHRQLHRQLEFAIANLKQTEDALVYSSGYLANLGSIVSLVGPRDLIMSDKLNHSSLKNGAILSQAKVIEYEHCHTEDLRLKLQENRPKYRRCLIIADSVFSMDGDLSPLAELISIASDFACMLLVDEAHATGVFGRNGAGCVEHFGYTGYPLIQVGTLSKALGSLGGYVAGSANLIDYLRNRSPSWIYTTGLTPGDTAAALKAIELVKIEPERRANLWQNMALLQGMLNHKLPFPSPIICFPLKDASIAMTISQKLKEYGIFAPAIRPPTVKTSRLRISLMATHKAEHLQQLANAINEHI